MIRLAFLLLLLWALLAWPRRGLTRARPAPARVGPCRALAPTPCAQAPPA